MEHVLSVPRYITSFDTTKMEAKETEVLIVGSGVSGLFAAERAVQKARVVLVTKEKLEESNTNYAQGGIAVVMNQGDTEESHVADTLKAGSGLCDERIVRLVVHEGPARVQDLISWGAKFDTEGGKLHFTREGGHSISRIVHAAGDATGREVQHVLGERIKSLASGRMKGRLDLLEGYFLIDLLTSQGECVGAILADGTGKRRVVWARTVILATGGAGCVYRETTNPPVATGDGISCAYRAGAPVMDMEFMQFHPTTLYIAGATRVLITEAVRGEGGLLRDRNGVRFMPLYHPLAELAPRDVVSRAILKQMQDIGDTHVYLDLRHLNARKIHKRFPFITEVCAGFHLDIAKDLIPVRPAAHYYLGGIRVDENGRSGLAGLFAAGEGAATGLHGANRLGSNSILEGMVFGSRTGQAAAAYAADLKEISRPKLKNKVDQGQFRSFAIDVNDARASLRALMWRQVGIERNGPALSAALERLEFWSSYMLGKEFADRNAWELQNMLLVARLATLAARLRCETRGVHYRTDNPDRDDKNWLRHISYHVRKK